jgi:hypothetical protein
MWAAKPMLPSVSVSSYILYIRVGLNSYTKLPENLTHRSDLWATLHYHNKILKTVPGKADNLKPTGFRRKVGTKTPDPQQNRPFGDIRQTA